MRKGLLILLGCALIGFGFSGFVHNPLFGIFPVNPLTNILSVLMGLLVIAAAALGEHVMQVGAWVFALVYLTVFCGGLFSSDGLLFGVLEVAGANRWLFLFLAVVFALIGALPKRVPELAEEPNPFVVQ